jgi:hypothetical protein
LEYWYAFGTIRVKLNVRKSRLFTFLDGSLSQRNQANTNSKEVQKLQKTNQQLQEENNLLKVKTEILVDMVTEIYCEDKLNREQTKPKK